MATKKYNLTKQFIENIDKPPKGSRACYKDSKVFGLELRVTDTGAKSFCFRRKVNNKDLRVTLGGYPDLSVEKARNLAIQAGSDIASGINPNKQNGFINAEPTFKEFFESYMQKYALVHKNKVTVAKNYKQYKRHLLKIQNLKLSQIDRDSLTALHINIGNKNGLYEANRLLSLLHSIFNKAIEWGWDGKNPAQGIKKFKEKSRDRFLQADELPRFWNALMEEQNIAVRDYIILSLLTGARKSNVLAMNWKNVYLEREQWYIPETKNGDSLTIALPSLAVDILKIRKESSTCEWIFPSSTSKSGHLEEPKKVWKRILDRAEIKDLRLHDLRRTLGSWQASTGATTAIIGKSLGHKNKNTTAIYERLNLDPVKQAVQRATDAMIGTFGSSEDIVGRLR